jgi:hypothetical protein
MAGHRVRMIRNKRSDKQTELDFNSHRRQIRSISKKSLVLNLTTFLAEEFVFGKKKMALQPSLVRPFRLRSQKVLFRLNKVRARFLQFFTNEPDRP